jgi:hypothetical protein
LERSAGNYEGIGSGDHQAGLYKPAERLGNLHRRQPGCQHDTVQMHRPELDRCDDSPAVIVCEQADQRGRVEVGHSQ